MGRPSDFTQEAADAICERLMLGQSLRAICAEAEMPEQRTVYRWLNANEAFRQQYTRAREVQADTLADECLEIADDSSRDTIKDDRGNDRMDAEWVARSRLRVDARKWMASKLAPKKYGDKVTTEVTGANGGPVEFTEIRRTIVDPSHGGA